MRVHRRIRIIVFTFTVCLLHCASVATAQIKGDDQQQQQIIPQITIPQSTTTTTIRTTTTSQPQVTFTNVFNAALLRPVSIDPSSDTCGNRSSGVIYYGSQKIECATSCPRTFSELKFTKQLFKENISLGDGNCTMASSQGLISKRAAYPTTPLCFWQCGCGWKFDTTHNTFSMWFKPDHNSMVASTLMALPGFEVEMFREKPNHDCSQLNVYTDVTDTRTANIPHGVWTLLTVRRTRLLSISKTVFAVSVNDTLLEPIVRNDADWTKTYSKYGDLTIGVSEYRIKQEFCQTIQVTECQDIGYSAAVRPSTMEESSGGRTGGQTGGQPLYYQNYDYEQNWLRFGLKKCPWNVDALKMFVCAATLPACQRNGETMKPCRSFCNRVRERCGRYLSKDELDKLTVYCSTLNNATTNCVGQRFTAEFGMFKGLVRDGRFYDRSLTNREVAVLYTGQLPDLRVLPECLCDSEHPIVHPEKEWLCEGYLESQPLAERLVGTNSSKYFLPAFFNDGSEQTAWASKTNGNNVSVIIDFQQQVQMLSVNITLHSPYPSLGIVISTERDPSIGFEIMQYLATDCRWFNMANDSYLLESNSVNCKPLFRLDAWPYGSSHKITVPFLSLRPGLHAETLQMTDDLIRFLKSNRIKLEFLSLSYRRDVKVVSEIKVEALRDCVCYLGGTVQGSLCDRNGDCECRHLPGIDWNLVDRHCNPYTASISPSYGPEAGGTVVTIRGGYFGTVDPKSVQTLQQYEQLDILDSNETLLTVVTKPLNSTKYSLNLLNQPTSLILLLESDTEIITDDQFTFKPNPQLERILPRKSFILGGVMQTVIGRHLDSVAAPAMYVTLVYDGVNYRQESSLCTVKNDTVMLCPSPYMSDLPFNLIRQPSKRDLRTHHERNTDDISDSDDSGTLSRRRRTSVVDPYINSAKQQFYLGFTFDGFAKYHNVSETLPDEGILYIYNNPEIETFDEEVRLFRTYSPHNDEFVIIKGNRLNYGCDVHDYTITVGESVCVITNLVTNTIVCKPPQQRPPLGMFHMKGAPRVKVDVGYISIVVGYLRYEERLTDSMEFRVAIGVIAALLVIIAVVIAVICYYRRHKKHEKHLQTRISYGAPNDYMPMQTNPRGLLDKLDPDLRRKIEKALVNTDRMVLGEVIGKGNFGEVHAGKLLSNSGCAADVAIKTLKETESIRQISEFLLEATIMQDFHHINVLCLLAVVIDNNVPYVIMPLMKNGDLRSLLINRQLKFTLREILEFGYDVAKGMAYLSAARFVHRDLAARNCMVDGDRVVKIADFGLARDIYEKDYYRVEDRQRPMPVKWMAIESLQSQTFTTQSDVWSYGVVLWELLTRGLKPYSHLDNIDVKRYLMAGRRLEKPAVAPDEIYELMLNCWQVNPNDRPTFAQICTQLAGLLGEDRSKSTPTEPPHDYLVIVE